MNTTTAARGLVRRLAAALPHLLIHSVAGMLIAALLGWVEVVSLNSSSVNEFNGLAWVIAVYFTGPVACALAAPFHVLCHMKTAMPLNRHVYSFSISIALYSAVWMVLHLNTT